MRKILIVSYLFAPENAIGALRPTKLAKYLSLKGNTVDIVTISTKTKIDEILVNDMQYPRKINELKHSGFYLASIQAIENFIQKKML